MANDNGLITNAVVEAALAADKGPDAKVASWSCDAFVSDKTGHTSDVKKLGVTYRSADDREHEVSYVVKAKQARRESFDDFFHVIHEKESTFYSEVIPLLNAILRDAGHGAVSTPKNFYQSTETGMEVILLENLRDQGYEMREKDVGIDAAHSMLVLKELAKLHAASMLLQQKTPDEDLATKFTCLRKEWTREFNVGCNFGEFMSTYLDIGIAMFEKMGGCETVIEWIKKIKTKAWELYEEQIRRESPFAAILHGDPWINNFLYKYDVSGNPIDVKFFDFQGCRKASVAIDLQHFFNMNLTDAVRRPNLDSFLKYYYNTLAQVMEDGGSKVPFSLEELTKEYRDRGFYGVLYSIMWHPNMVRQPEDDVDILDQGNEAKRTEKDNVLRMVDRNPLLKPRILSVIEEWTECGLISV